MLLLKPLLVIINNRVCPVPSLIILLQAAVNLGKHIMTELWILEAWENRHDM